MRLTKKSRDYGYKRNPNESFDDCLEKLGQLEDIEEKLGIELKIIGTALILGIHTKKWGFIDKDNLSFNRLRVRIISKCIELPFVGEQGYGKTWALTPGELL